MRRDAQKKGREKRHVPKRIGNGKDLSTMKSTKNAKIMKQQEKRFYHEGHEVPEEKKNHADAD